MTTAADTEQSARDRAFPTWVSRGRVPCLDGMRAVAITLVVLSHVARSIGSPRLSSTLELANAGHLGVTLFFVLSGFLITLLLLREQSDAAAISLKNFYVRRVLRLLPAYAAYLSVMAILNCSGGIQVPARFWTAATTYTMCFIPHLDEGWHLAHVWSLSVEENFYLLWPLLLVMLKPKRALVVITVYVAGTPLLRYFLWWRFRDAIDIEFCSLTQMGSIATGCILAGLISRDARSRYVLLSERHARLIFSLGIMGMALSIAMDHVSGKFDILFGDPACAAFGATAIAGLLFMKENPLTRLMNSRPVVFVGVLSYSLYLWQQPFTSRSSFWACRWPANAILALIAAAFSYSCIERPFLGIKERFSARPKARSIDPGVLDAGGRRSGEAAVAPAAAHI